MKYKLVKKGFVDADYGTVGSPTSNPKFRIGDVVGLVSGEDVEVGIIVESDGYAGVMGRHAHGVDNDNGIIIKTVLIPADKLTPERYKALCDSNIIYTCGIAMEECKIKMTLKEIEEKLGHGVVII